MKTVLLSILLMLALVLLSGCANKHEPGYFDQTVQASDMVLTYLSENNAEGIKELFCSRAKELPDIDEQIQGMLDYFDGKMVSYDKKVVERTSYSKDDYVLTEISAYGQIGGIVTDTGKEYTELYVFYCAINVRQPDLVGIYKIVIEAADGTESKIGITTQY